MQFFQQLCIPKERDLKSWFFLKCHIGDLDATKKEEKEGKQESESVVDDLLDRMINLNSQDLDIGQDVEKKVY